MGGTRYLRTHAEKANLEPYRKSSDFKPFVSLSMSWVMEGAAVAENSGTPTGEVAKGRRWGLQWDGGDVNPLLASECDCFIGCDTTTQQLMKGQQRQLTTSVPSSLPISERYSSSKSFISDFGPANQNASLLRLRFIRNRWIWVSPSSVLENAEPWFPRSSLSEPQSSCEHSLVSPRWSR